MYSIFKLAFLPTTYMKKFLFEIIKKLQLYFWSNAYTFDPDQPEVYFCFSIHFQI